MRDPWDIVFGEHHREADKHRLPENPPASLPPDPVSQCQRLLKRVKAPEEQRAYIGIDEVPPLMEAAINAYLSETDPQDILLIQAPPASGKTRLAVQVAEQLASSGMRVGYLGPRHDFFQDIQKLAKHSEFWYEWQPRCSPKGTDRSTCIHASRMNEWSQAGHGTLPFCQQICGVDYMNHGCAYHAQRKTGHPIIFGQHEHLLSGNPLMREFGVLFVDESPISALAHGIPIHHTSLSAAMCSLAGPHAALLRGLAQLAENGARESRAALIDLLGGAAAVVATLEQCETVSAHQGRPNATLTSQPVPSGHVPQLITMLREQALAVLAGCEINPRIAVGDGNVILHPRVHLHEHLPQHIICLDATGDPLLYQALFNRPVRLVKPEVKPIGRVFQLTDAAYGVGTLRDQDRPDGSNPTMEKLAVLVQRICEKKGYQHPVVITHKRYKRFFSSTYTTGHFYGERGTNEFEGADALFVVGTPMLNWPQFIVQAMALFDDREQPFSADGASWLPCDQVYNYIDADGFCWAKPTSNFPPGSELRALVIQAREDEIIQVVHRPRINRRNADVWLLANLPIDGLPITELTTLRKELDVPEQVNIRKWIEARRLAAEFHARNQPLRASDLEDHLDLSPATARKYIQKLLEDEGERWDVQLVPAGRMGGRPARTLIPRQ